MSKGPMSVSKGFWDKLSHHDLLPLYPKRLLVAALGTTNLPRVQRTRYTLPGRGLEFHSILICLLQRGHGMIASLSLSVASFYERQPSHLCLGRQTHGLVDGEGELDLHVEVEDVLNLVAYTNHVRIPPDNLHVRHVRAQLRSQSSTR